MPSTSSGSCAPPPKAASLAERHEPVRRDKSARELLVLEPVRDDRIRAEPAHLVRFVILEVALEPLHMAVALEGEDVRRDAVEEPAIVADDDGAAGEILQRLFQRAERIDVKVV